MRAVVSELGPAFDLLATYRGVGDFFFERAGIGVSGHGTAVTVQGSPHELPLAVADALGAVAARPGGPAPLAVGALPFDP
ncbi:MAG: hypothetical protein ABI828_07200, partial [Actinomycetota bacterium]